ncbi:MAG: SirB2 family protein [Gammaproteobacteria bacterium]
MLYSELIEFYPDIRLIHITAALLSGSLFLLRGVAMWSGSPAGMRTPVRYLSYTIDTILLAAAVTLATILHLVPFVDPWITTKILLVLSYVVLGSLALRRSRSVRWRRAFFILAMLVFATIFTVARSHYVLPWT